MSAIYFCHPTGSETAAARARHLRAQIPDRVQRRDAVILAVDPAGVPEIAGRAPEIVVATGYGPEGVAAFGLLCAPCIWDMAEIDAAAVAGWLAAPEDRAALIRALGVTRSACAIPRETALAIEDALLLGLSSHDLATAIDICRTRTVVLLGAGLGNMIYGTGMVRWLAETQDCPVDLVIHERFDEAVALFAGAPWLNAVYNGFDFLAGRSYELMVSAVTAGAWRPPFEAARSLWLNLDHSYNEEGRFVPEPQLNFLGLEKVFGRTPSLTDPVPMPFIRDIAYSHPGGRLLGVANGQKSSAWAKREWSHMADLVARLTAEGWQVRSFGLPGEEVAGAEDFTGLPMREVIERIAECSYFASHDGGLCHIAEALGVPTLWLFGSTGSIKNGPVHAHSRTLLSWRDCGPCLYRIDWQRCDSPACMEDLSVDMAYEALEEMRRETETDGHRPRPRPVPERLLDYETGALSRRPPAGTRALYEVERLDIFGSGSDLLVRQVVRLLRAGDPVGAAAVAAGLARRDPENPAVRFVFAVMRQLHPGPTPLSPPLAEMALPPLAVSETGEILKTLSMLDLAKEEHMSLFMAGLRYWLEAGSRREVSAYLEAVARFSVLLKNYVRPIQRHLERFSEDARNTFQSTNFEDSPSQQRMRAVRNLSPSERLAAQAEEMGQALDLPAGTVAARAFAPHLAAIDTAGRAPLVLRPAGRELRFAPHETVVAIVPHVRVKGAPAGSTSNLILAHMERLATLGLRPVVWTAAFDDIPDFWTMRDSVTFVQGHRHWSAAQWGELAAAYEASTVLSYAGAARRLDLPEAVTGRIVEIDFRGLSDPEGMLTEFPERQNWSFGAPPLETDPGTPAVPADALTAELMLTPELLPGPGPARAAVTVLLPEARDFPRLVQLASAMPEVSFTVQTPFLHRGIEKNLRTVVPQPLGPANPETSALVQFSTRPATLSAEALRWIETGGRAVAAIDPGPAPALAARLDVVSEAGTLTGWIAALRATLAAGWRASA